jgi:hypothetical protein
MSTAGNVSFLPPVENPGRGRKIQDAVDTIASEIARLERLQKAEDQRRAARAETAAITARALRKFEHRQASKHLRITVDRAFFRDLGELALSCLHGEARASLCRELDRLWEREE